MGRQYKFNAHDVNLDNWHSVKTKPEPSKGLRKLKARNMLDAIAHGGHSRGNHTITFNEDHFTFYYRGTPVASWDVPTNQYTELDTGPFEASAATMNQRKVILGAIHNFREVYAL